MESIKRTFTHENMAKLISVYYNEGLENKEVKVDLCSGDNGYIFANIVEVSRTDKATKRVFNRIEKDKFESIVREIYELAGQQVTDIVNYGKEGSTIIEHGFTKVVTPELANRVVVTTKQKVLVR